MLDAILKKFRALVGIDGPAKADSRPVDLAKLRLLTEYFSIGNKLRYSPEFQRDIVLDTLIVAYGVNHKFVYSRDAVRSDRDGVPASFVIGEEKTAMPASSLRRFLILVPDTTALEGTLDYTRRSNIGPGGQFRKGNIITLMANAGAKGVCNVDTHVIRVVDNLEGPFAKSSMVLLDPDLDTITFTDQRKEPRMLTNIPVEVYVNERSVAYPGSLRDLSGGSARLHLQESKQGMPVLKVNDAVMIVMNFPKTGHSQSIKGKVFRYSAGVGVVLLQKLYKDGEFVNFSQMDTLELKTAVLNY